MRTAWIDGVYDAELLHELSVAVDETSGLMRCRKALCDEGLRSLLDLLQSMKTHHVSDIFLLLFCTVFRCMFRIMVGATRKCLNKFVVPSFYVLVKFDITVHKHCVINPSL